MADNVLLRVISTPIFKRIKEVYIPGIRYNFQDRADGTALRINILPQAGGRPRYYDITIKEILI